METTNEILNELVRQSDSLASIESTLSLVALLIFGFLTFYCLLKWRNK